MEKHREMIIKERIISAQLQQLKAKSGEREAGKEKENKPL